jgi:hypothetical protein
MPESVFIIGSGLAAEKEKFPPAVSIQRNKAAVFTLYRRTKDTQSTYTVSAHGTGIKYQLKLLP